MRVVGSTAHRQHTIYEAILQGPIVLMISHEKTPQIRSSEAFFCSFCEP